METKAVVYRTWDDLVFEKRNKEYGAYALRKSYNNQVLLGFGLSVALISLLFLIPHGEKIERPIIQDPIGKVIIMDPPIFEIKPPRVRRITPPQPRTVQVASIIPIVTHDVVEEPADETILETEVISDGEVEGGNIDGDDAGVDSNGGSVVPIDLTTKCFVFAEVMPSYVGGEKAMMEYLSRNVRYPHAPRRLGIDGTVFVSFVVKADSTVGDVQILKGIHPDCDKEAARAIASMPDWISGKQSKIPVNVRMVLPIKFVLRD